MECESVPEGWRQTTLGSVAEFVNGDRGKNYPTHADRVVSGVPFINTGHIEPSGRLTSDGMDYITRESFDRLRSGKVRQGDIVYCLRGSTIGKTARNHFAEGAIASSLVIVRATEQACQDYLYFYLSSPYGQQLARRHDNGSAQPNLSVRELSSYPLPLPPVREQRAIAHLLGTLDDRITLLRETNATLEGIAQALFKSWFMDIDPVRAKMEGRTPEGMDEATAALFPDGFEESKLGLVPKGWKFGTLADLSDLNPETWTAKNHPDTVAYIDLANAKDNEIASVTEFAFDDAPTRARRVLRGGDTIVGTVRPGNRSFAYIHEPATNLTASTGFAVLRPSAAANTEFVYLAATQDTSIEHLAHVADGAAYPAVRPDVVHRLQCVVPDEQALKAFHLVANPLLAKIAVNQKLAQTLANLRDTLLPRLISGQLPVPSESYGDLELKIE